MSPPPRAVRERTSTRYALATGVLAVLLTAGGVARADPLYLPIAGVSIEAEPGWRVVASDGGLDGVLLEEGRRESLTGVTYVGGATCQQVGSPAASCPPGFTCSADFGGDPALVGICDNLRVGGYVAGIASASYLSDATGARLTYLLLRRVEDAVTAKLGPDTPGAPIGPHRLSMPWWGWGRTIAEAFASHDEGADSFDGGGRLGAEIFVDVKPNRFAALLVGGGVVLGWDDTPRFMLDVRGAAGLGVHLGKATIGALATAGTDRRGGGGFASYVGVEGFVRIPTRKVWVDLDYQRNSHEHRLWLRVSGRGEGLGLGLEWLHLGRELGVGDDLVGVFAGFGPP